MGYKYKVIMKKFIGTKVIKAEPMTVTEAQVLGVEIKPATVEENGYLVEYKDGYKSWSPKSVFDETYKPAETFLDRLAVEQQELTEKVVPIALVFLSNPIREEAPETFNYFANQGVEIKVISGDNPITVSQVAQQAGIENAEKE